MKDWQSLLPTADMVIVDSAVYRSGALDCVENSRLGAPVQAKDMASYRHLSLVVVDSTPTVHQVSALARCLEPGQEVLAIGGGSVIDLAVLAAASVGSDLLARLNSPERGGLRVGPDRASVRVTAVPTTVGTGAESSMSACCRCEAGVLLIRGRSMLPETILRDLDLLSELPVFRVLEGAHEALFRLGAPFWGDPTHRSAPDMLVHDLTQLVVRSGEELCARVSGNRTTIPKDARGALRELACASAASHGLDVHQGRHPFSAPSWAVATELSWDMGCEKLPALAYVHPRALQAAHFGAEATVSRVNQWWSWVEGAMENQRPMLPGEGLRRLLERWGARAVRPSTETMHRTAFRATRRWGAGLPSLNGASKEDVLNLLCSPQLSARDTGAVETDRVGAFA